MSFQKRSKYRNVPTEYRGVRYASRAEADRANLLDVMVAGGLVRWWLPQVKFRLGVPENVYIVDFLVMDKHGEHVEDVKGRETAKFKRDKRLWKAYGPCPLWIVKESKIEVVTPDDSR